MRSKTRQDLIIENEELRTRLAEAEDILRAIRSGEVDAFLITGVKGARIATQDGADSAYRVLIESISEGAAILNCSGMLIYCNSSFADLLKAPLQDVMGASLYRFTTPPNYEILKKLLEQAQTHACTGEVNFSCDDGTTIPMQLSFDPMQIHGQPGICALSTDLTERKRVEEAQLRENEEKYRRLFEAESDAIYLVDSSTGKILDANIAASHLFGYSHAEVVGLHNSDLSSEPEKIGQVAGDQAEPFPGCWYKKKDGSIFPGEMTTAHLTLKGRAMHLVAIRDISDRRRSEAVIAALALRNQTLLNTSTDGIHVLDELGHVVDANPAFCAMLGYSREEMLRLNVANWELKWSSDELVAKINELIARPALFETRHRRKDGTIREIEINSVGVFLGGCSYLYASARDITERKQAEADLRASEQQYHDMFETNTAVKLLIDPASGAIVKANQAAAEFYGWSSHVLETMNINQINTLSAEQIKVEMGIAARRGRTYFEFSHRLASGEIRDVEIHSSPMENNGRTLLFSIIHDISDRKKAEETLRVNEERYRMLVEQAAEAILVYDVDLAKIVDANSIAEQLFGCSREFLCLQDDISIFYAKTRPDSHSISESMADYITHALAGEVIVSERDLVTANAVTIPCEERLVRLPSLGHRLLRASYVEIAERKRLEEELRNFSLADDLTGLYNRRGFFALAQQHMKTARRQEEQLFLIFIDLDGLKQINDTLGHLEGDHALTDTADILKKTFRASDIIARLGGDEFAVLAGSLDTDAEKFSKRLQSQLDAHNTAGHRPYQLAMSVGIVVYDPEAPMPIANLLAHADAAMYEQKRAKREISA